MSIRAEINNRLGEGRLFQLLPTLADSPVGRTMFISSEISGLVRGPWSNAAFEYRFSKLRADFEVFIEGRIIAVGAHPYKKKKTAYMARLDEPSDETWEIRSRDPKPGIRVFGRFAEKDAFVALTWGFREDLGRPGSKEWRDAIEQCKTEWRKLFPTYPPLSGADYNDYVSNFFLV